MRIVPLREFCTTDGEIADPNEINTIINDLKYDYDEFKRIEERRNRNSYWINNKSEHRVASWFKMSESY